MKQEMSPISAGNGIITINENWIFGGDIPKVFDEHIRRFVPYYEVGYEIICMLSGYFIKDDFICYDVGSINRDTTQKAC